MKELAALRVLIGNEDVTSVIADSGGTFSSVDPGGFESCSLNFPRDLPETIRGQPVLITSGLRTAWEGRVSQIARSLGHNTTVMGEGYGATFKKQAASMVFVDRDLSKWQQAGYQRQNDLVSGNFQLASFQVGPDPTNNNPALVMQLADSWVAPYDPIAEAWYDAGPDNTIVLIYYDVNFDAALLGNLNFRDFVIVSQDNALTTFEATASLYTAGGTEQLGYFAADPGRFAAIQHYYNATPAGAQGAQYNAYYHALALYGPHGLPGRGADPVGFYPSDIVGWVLGQMAGTVPGIAAGVILDTDESGYVVPHSVYYTPVTLDTILNDMAVVQGWHWGVWPGLSPLLGDSTPRLDFRPRPGDGEWTAFFHREQCESLDLREDLTQQFDTAIVNFTDTAGVPGSVTVTADNPVLDEAGLQGQVVVFSGGTMDPDAAAVFGQESLVLTNSQTQVSGSAQISAPIDGPNGPTPGFMLRPGIDRPRIGDIAGQNFLSGGIGDFPLTRVEGSISSSGLSTSLELGTGGNLVETLQARLTAATTLAGQGG